MDSSENPQSNAFLSQERTFARTHIGPREKDLPRMFEMCGIDSLDQLVRETVPDDIRLRRELDLPSPLSDHQALAALQNLARDNKPFHHFLGLGYSNCHVPPVIQRNVLENPGWYTQYTPYQAEIAQGRLEALLTFQTMVCDLTGLEIANASLLDEGTAAAEAMSMCLGLQARSGRQVILASAECHPQTLHVVQTRAKALDVDFRIVDQDTLRADDQTAAVILQYPDTRGSLGNPEATIQSIREAGALVIVCTDLLALTLLRPPGELGADVAVGSAQRFGVPLGFGGPHAAFFATRDAYKRNMPGRIVGISKDAEGKPAYRLTLQTREQHIRRDKATSNICTAQALLANMAALYAVWHGPEGLTAIASRTHQLTKTLAQGALEAGWKLVNPSFFDTVTLEGSSGAVHRVRELAEATHWNFRYHPEGTRVSIALDETTQAATIEGLVRLLSKAGIDSGTHSGPDSLGIPEKLSRKSPFLTHPVFHQHRSETEMLRYIKKLEGRDLSLAHSMIPLGSCTMKLNATAEMFPISWPGFAQVHPFAPLDQVPGYLRMFEDLESWLGEITGLPAVSLQPNAGSQGEYAGLLVIRAHHEARGHTDRRICLIPTSAHGTNPASAVMAGFQVVPVQCDQQGNISLADLQAKADLHQDRLGALMVTYPSTHGVFEYAIRDICRIIHEHGGQVYLDGANMNAQVGLCRPGDFGADVCHLNLHKTFCIPHGGGGPGMGPICAAEHLRPFLPATPKRSSDHSVGAVSAAPWGSAAILPISWMYIAMSGAAGLKDSTRMAILNANYIARRLQAYFPVLFKGPEGRVAHECIIDFRGFKSVTVEDVAKRLMDYGFHAPTISWPVAGTMMIEPTESEPLEELDRFCEAMIRIHGEISQIERGEIDSLNNPLKNAPHTAECLVAQSWDHPYSREVAVFPAPWTRDRKFWPPVRRIDNVHGDRNPICTCVGMEAFTES